MSTSATSTSSVVPSLWWDPFSSLLSDLENAPLSSDLPLSLAKKLKENHAWFVDTFSCFKPPNAKSKEALNSQKVKIGSRELIVKPELKEKALHISSYLCLDEVQSYILVERSVQRNEFAIDSVVAEYLHLILLHYYIERQCLLKCTRQILMHALHVGIRSTEENVVRDEALKLIADGLEHKSITVLQGLLYSSHPEQMDVDLFTLWAEETLIEDNLVLDIIFLIYYESLSTCTSEAWKDLCLLYKGILSGSCNFGKLAISNQALKSSYHAKIQLLLILIETLDLENLLQLLHDDIPFRQGASNFSLTDIQEMDALLSSFNVVEIKEVGPLIHAWAVCLRLILSLPETEENNVLMEIDHDGYIRLAFEVTSFSYFVEILESDLLKESDGPVAGYRSVLRTFISAFIACYEINLQLEDSTLALILDFICKVYRGEESLCVQFWDKNSFIDGPIRCLLCNLEGEFPYRTVELVRFLSSLCEGSWPAECVYNFLDKSVGISSLFEITSECLVDSISQVVETHLPLRVPGFEGLVIPSKTHGHVLKFIDGNTALVRWEYEQSGVLVLLLRLAQEMYLESSEEVLLTFDLLSRLVSFNMGVAFSLMDIGNSFYFQAAEMNGRIEKNMWMVEITCHVMRNLSPSPRGAALMSMGFRILSQMLNCAPSQVVASALNANIFEMASKPSMFDVGYDGLSSGSWFVSGKLAKMLLIDSEQNDCGTPLTISVLDFNMQLLETRLENELVLALVVFSLQYILVNHEYWKYKVRHIRWRITLKVLEVMKKCIISLQFYEKLGVVIRDMLLGDSSVHNALFRLSFTTKQTLENLYVNRHFELFELEGFQLAVDAALDILYILLSKFSKDLPPSLFVFHQAVLSSSTKQVPAVAIASLISYSRDPAIQIAAAKVLSSLLITADYLQMYLSGNVCFALQDDQITDLRHSVKSALLEESDWNEDMFFAIINLLTSAARHQPAFLVAIFFAKEDMEVQLGSTNGVNKPKDEVPGGAPTLMKSSLIDSLMEHIERSNDYINSAPQILLSVVEFLKALWEGAVQYITILEFLKGSEKFWKQLANCIAIVDKLKDSPLEKLSEADIQNLAYKYQCQSAILEIMAYEMFLQKKLLHAELLLKDTPETKRSPGDSGIVERSNYANDCDLKDILMKWCEKSILQNLIKSYTSCKDNHEASYRGKVAASLFMVHVMGKLANGDAGSLSFSLIEQTNVTFKNLSCQPGFSELLAQYSQRGYSEGKELTILVLNDLYYHIHGELEGRKIVSGPFKDLAEFLVGADCLQKYRHIEKDEHFAYPKHALYDLKQLRLDLRMDIWDHSNWKASKETAEIMLNCMQEVNSMIMLARSEFSALKALTTVLILFEDNSIEKKTSARFKIPSELCFSCIDRICNCFRSTVESLSRSFDASEEMLDCLAAQAELLLHFMRSVQSNCSLSVCVVVLQTSCTCLKVLCDLGLSVAGIKRLAKLLLIVLLFAIEFTRGLDKESDDFLEVSNVSLQLLPILCNCITTAEYSAISLSAIDLILRSFLTPRTWFPIIRKHLQLQHVIVILQDKRSLAFVPTILKFLLTLASVRGGAEMLLNAGFFWAIKVVFADLSNGRHSTVDANSNNFITSSNKTEKPQQIWGLGLSVITAMVHSLGESSFCTDIMDNLIPYLFLEKAYLISYHLCAPEFPSENHNKKRQRAQETQTSLIALKETEHTVMLLCTLAKNWNSWNKTLKEMDSQLREKTIHLLAFFGRGIHRFGDSSGRAAPLFCPPVFKEDFECSNKPSFLNSRNGWFALSPLCCVLKPKLSAVSADSTAFVIRGQPTETTNTITPTYFSDLVALQIYRIVFLVLKFLCIEAEGAANRSAEVGYLDLSHFPELPMPEILHSLQDQAIAIVSELCNASKLSHVDPEIQSVCLLMLQITEMALYLEFCVQQICGIRPVLGRVEDFAKEFESLLKAIERHAFLKGSTKSLKQIVSLIYPGLSLTEGFI